LVNVVFSGDNVTVLGGPTQLDVDLNVGANGTRGSIFFVGNENPNSLNPSQDFVTFPLVFDIFINVNPASNNYLQAYQYVNQDNQNLWIPVFKILQEGYKETKVLNFTNGEAEINIRVSDIGLNSIPFDSLTNSFAYFNIQATISNVNLNDPSEPQKPLSFSVKPGDTFFDNEGTFDAGEFPLFLPITFNAVEFNGTSWNPVNNKKNIVYLSISFTSPNEIFLNNNFSGEEN
jgi:hypothetical protein